MTISVNDLKSLYGNGNEDSLSTYMNMTFKAGGKTKHINSFEGFDDGNS